MFYTLYVIDDIKKNLWQNHAAISSKQKWRLTRRERRNIIQALTCHALHVKLFKFLLCSIRLLSLWVEICGEAVRTNLIWWKPLPHPDDAVDESGEVDESRIVEGSWTINESETVESGKAESRESEEIKWWRT